MINELVGVPITLSREVINDDAVPTIEQRTNTLRALACIKKFHSHHNTAFINKDVFRVVCIFLCQIFNVSVQLQGLELCSAVRFSVEVS